MGAICAVRAVRDFTGPGDASSGAIVTGLGTRQNAPAADLFLGAAVAFVPGRGAFAGRRYRLDSIGTSCRATRSRDSPSPRTSHLIRRDKNWGIGVSGSHQRYIWMRIL